MQREEKGMDEQEIKSKGIAFYVLSKLHELCIAMPELASSVEEISPKVGLSLEETVEALNKLASDSLVTYLETDGKRKFYLTSSGIIAACSIFT
jgi:predicted transcriptional regulator